jgi:hypothetical protein
MFCMFMEMNYLILIFWKLHWIGLMLEYSVVSYSVE